MANGPNPEDGTGRQRPRLRLRAAVDLCAVVAVVVFATLFADSPAQALIHFLASSGFGLLFFIVRRGADLSATARAERWRTTAVEGRGMTVREWNSGAQLKPWSERRDNI